MMGSNFIPFIWMISFQHRSFFLILQNTKPLKGGNMQTYVLLTKLSADVSQRMKDRAEIGHSWLDQVKAKCPEVKFISHYALLGHYDFIDIYEAPNEETAAKVSMISQANGAFQAESLPAIPYKRFIELTKEL